MQFKEIQDLLKLVNRTDLTEVEIEKKDFKIKIRRKSPESNVIYTQQPAVVPQASAPATPAAAAPQSPPAESEKAPAKQEKPAKPKEENAEKDYYVFRAPMIGTFYRASSPDTPPFAKVGDQVQKGQVLCIIEAMKLFNEIDSEIDGKIVKILVEDAQPVEYDQPLFLIDTEG